MTGDEDWNALPGSAGLCRFCQYPFLNRTKRGTSYMRCTRASWDERLSRYPQLPVAACAGFERAVETDQGTREPD